MGGRIFRNYYKGHMDKTWGMVEAREEGGFVWGGGGSVREKMQTTVVEQQ